MTQNNDELKTWAVFYRYGADAERRDLLRPLHRKFLAGLAEQGLMPAYGRFDDEGPAGALLIAKAHTAEEVFEMLGDDPYQINGLVEGVNIRHWPAIWA